MSNTKQERLLEIFFRALRGEGLSVQRLAEEYGVSTKSISRDLNDLKAFLADHRELVGNTELQYIYQEKRYRLCRDKFITENRRKFTKSDLPAFDEGLLREQSLPMRPGRHRTIRFQFTGPSVQVALDKLPAARIIEQKGGMYTLEAEACGDGIKMWLLSQGSWVKVISPAEFVEEMREEVERMRETYITSKIF